MSNSRSSRQITIMALTLAIVASLTFAQSKLAKKSTDAAPPTKAPSKTGTWHTVKKDEFKVELKLSGTFESTQAWPIKIKPHGIAVIKVIEAIEPGAAVNKGDQLITFDTKNLKRAIASAELSDKLARMAIEQAEAELALLEKTVPMDIAATERIYKRAVSDHDRFLKLLFPLSKQAVEFSLKSSQQQLEYYKEELNQLEKMYKEDDLTEETEEIILKRQRAAYERAKFSYKRSLISYETQTKFTLPRSLFDAEEKMKRATLQYNKNKAVLPMTLDQKRIALKKLLQAHEISSEKLKEMKDNLKALDVRAPADGIVYYGKISKGKAVSAALVAPQLKPEASVKAGTTIMTILTPKPNRIRAALSESKLHMLDTGATGYAVPAAFPNLAASVQVASISNLATSTAGHDLTIDIKSGALPRVMPGMSCSITIVGYKKDDAISLPVSAVKRDGATGWYVNVKTTGDKTEKRSVKLGKRSSSRVEILDGLKVGDKVKG